MVSYRHGPGKIQRRRLRSDVVMAADPGSPQSDYWCCHGPLTRYPAWRWDSPERGHRRHKRHKRLRGSTGLQPAYNQPTTEAAWTYKRGGPEWWRRPEIVRVPWLKVRIRYCIATISCCHCSTTPTPTLQNGHSPGRWPKKVDFADGPRGQRTQSDGFCSIGDGFSPASPS